MAGSTGIVVIGRNEATNLEICLKSCSGQSGYLIYADSGSSDDSLEIAAKLNVPAINLDDSVPMTAARGRNAGFDWLLKKTPGMGYVQFIDGDCELIQGWVEKGVEFLEGNPGAAIVYGQLQERYPERSVYNLLADIEWRTPVGEVSASGGIFLARAEAFQAVGGFRTNLVGGEEPELCIRLQDAGWELFKLDQPMAYHDADMLKFSQWWKRSTRDGYTFAEGMALHGRSKYLHNIRETLSAVVWAGIFPIVILGLSLFFSPLFFWLLLVYPLQILRVSCKGQRDTRSNLIWSFFLAVRKFPELQGVTRYCVDRWIAGKHRLVQ